VDRAAIEGDGMTGIVLVAPDPSPVADRHTELSSLSGRLLAGPPSRWYGSRKVSEVLCADRARRVSASGAAAGRSIGQKILDHRRPSSSVNLGPAPLPGRAGTRVDRRELVISGNNRRPDAANPEERRP